MRIHEIITESAELEEGWKSKLGAAALAGAAALGGGHTAHAQNQQPTAQTQQRVLAQGPNYQLADKIGELSVLMNNSKFQSMISPEQKQIYNDGFSTLKSTWGKFSQADNKNLQKRWEDAQQKANRHTLRDFLSRADQPRSGGDLDRWLDNLFGTRSSQVSSGGVRSGANGPNNNYNQNQAPRASQSPQAPAPKANFFE